MGYAEYTLENSEAEYDTMFYTIPRRERWFSGNQAYLEALSHDTDLFLSATDDLLALNITAKKSAVKDSLTQARLLLQVKDARELLTLLCHVGRPGFEKTVTYGCVFFDLMAQIQTQAWHLAEMRSQGLKEILAEQQSEATNSENGVSGAALDVARSFAALAHFSIDALKDAGKQLAATMDRNVAAMTIATVQMSNAAKNEVEVLLRSEGQRLRD